tara:strand:- start:414 stop:1550 length:1137 start_codon:yes stop_codon:yes gene_type:complete
MKKKIAIIGSGIAGLTVANLFKQNPNFEVMVYEREKMLSLDQGYGIQLAPNSISILNKIGFSKIDNDNFFNPSELSFYSSDSKKICDLNLSNLNSAKVKYTTLKRSVLIEFLKSNLFTNNIRFGKEVKKISKLKEKLLINFKDNTNDLVDFIIVSDGIFSNTKSIIENKNINPIYNGSIAIRTILKSSLEFNYDKKNISLVMLKNAHIVIYPINKQGELNLVCIVRQKLSNSIDLNTLVKNEILSQNKNLENLFKNKLEYWPIYITKKPSKSIYENLFYLGDAFYTFPPTMAQGASQSIEGAYELFNLLSQDNKKVQSIYFQKRLEKTKLINSRSRLNYYSFHLSNPILVKARNAILKKITKSKKFLNRYLGNIYQGT